MASTVDLCVVADVQLRFGTADNPSGVIQAAVTAASRKILARYNREFTPLSTAQARLFRVNGYMVDFDNDDLRAVSSVVLDPNGSPSTLSAATDYRLMPRNLSTLGTYTGIMLSQLIPLISGTTLGFGFAELQITGDWGCFQTSTVPEDIRDACVETVGSWLDRAVQEYGNAAAAGDPEFAAPDRFAGYGIPSSAHNALAQYDRLSLR